MPKKSAIAINLIPVDPFLESPMGRFMQWAMGAGRYIVIFTEIVVILSFGARFTLDRQLTDINEEMYDQIEYIKQFEDTEKNIMLAQAQIKEIKGLEDSTNILAVFQELNRLTPRDVVLDKLVIGQRSLSAGGAVYTQSAFSMFVSNLQLSPQFNTINIGKIESAGSDEPGFIFSLTALTRTEPTKAKAVPKPSTTESTEENLDI